MKVCFNGEAAAVREGKLRESGPNVAPLNADITLKDPAADASSYSGYGIACPVHAPTANM